MGILKLVLMEEQKGIVISFFFSCSLPNPWKATDKWRVLEEEHYCKGGGGIMQIGGPPYTSASTIRANP